jgi:hypothetical protein
VPRILIITNSHLCRNPRPLKEAETFGHPGYDVTMLTVRDHQPSAAYDRELHHDAPFRRETVDMLPGFATSRTEIFRRRLLLWSARRIAADFEDWHSEDLLPENRRQQAARRLAEDRYCWEREAPRLLELVATAIQNQ